MDVNGEREHRKGQWNVPIMLKSTAMINTVALTERVGIMSDVGVISRVEIWELIQWLYRPKSIVLDINLVMVPRWQRVVLFIVLDSGGMHFVW